MVLGEVRAKLAGERLLIWYGSKNISALLTTSSPHFGGQRRWFCCLLVPPGWCTRHVLSAGAVHRPGRLQTIGPLSRPRV